MEKGLPFRDAYKIVSEIVAHCIENGLTLESMPISDYKSFCDKFDDDVYSAISLESCVNRRSVAGGPSPEQVAKQIADVRKTLSDVK